MRNEAVITWREVLDKHQFALVDELTVRLDSEIRDAVARAVATEQAQAAERMERVRRATAESLNQTLRLLRRAPAQAPALQLLADGSAPYASGAVVLLLENGHARSLGVRGITVENGFAFSLDEAAAIEAAIHSKDPVVALADEREISPPLAAAFASGQGDGSETGEDRKVYLFPVVARQNVVAMLVASGQVASAPLELLCEAAGMKIETLITEAGGLTPLKSPPELVNSELVQIGATSLAAPSTPPAPERRTWDELSAEDQRLHLQAQRTVRVRVAEIRLYHADALRKGVFDGNIYEALRSEIDAARADFLQTFLSRSPTMVDYLHLEVLRSLAHDDDRLLGPDYPGPMV
jgi:hypothetical protein